MKPEFQPMSATLSTIEVFMKTILLSVVIFTLLSACSREPESTELVADLAAGKAIAEAECSDCHGMDGRGESPETPNLAAQTADYLVEAMHSYRDGGRLHAALQDMTSAMSEADIVNIAVYYASQPALELPDNAGTGTGEDDFYSQGAAVAEVCEDCHGNRGISTEEGVPSLAGQQPVYLIMATQEYKKGTRGHKDTEDMLTGLKQVDIEKMAMYFASQSAPEREAPPLGDPVAGKASSGKCGKCHGFQKRKRPISRSTISLRTTQSRKQWRPLNRKIQVRNWLRNATAVMRLQTGKEN